MVNCYYCGEQTEDFYPGTAYRCLKHPCPVYHIEEWNVAQGKRIIRSVSIIVTRAHKYYEIKTWLPYYNEHGVIYRIIWTHDYQDWFVEETIAYLTKNRFTPENANDKIATYLTFS